jgi:hypothetical protein
MSSWYCALPFKHVFVDSTGLSPCCNTVGQFGLDVSIDEYKSHPKLLELQKQFLDGRTPAACSVCLHQEKIQNKSMRIDSNIDYNHRVFDSTEFDFIHLSQSNLCNFKCRSCSPRYSHGIVQEHKKYPELFADAPQQKFVEVNPDNYKWIIKNLSSIKRLLITGGEPTVMPEIRHLFEFLLQTPRPQPQPYIMMTTNCSWTDNFWYQAIDGMSNLHITASVDAVGDAAQLIRHGTVWNQVERNVKWLAQHASSFDINTVISNLNINHLYDLLQFCRQEQIASKVENGGKQGDLGLRHQFTIANGVNEITCFPDDLKTKTLKHLDQCLALDLDPDQLKLIKGLIVTVQNSTYNHQKWQSIVEYQTKLDQIRGENHLKLL